MKYQVTLTVAEGKRLIAKAVAGLDEVRRALTGGRILLISGTTVSAVSVELGFGPLWISGRIDPSGTRTAGADHVTGNRALLVTGGNAQGVDTDVERAAGSLGSDDLIITGANILDNHGCAALALAAPGGGPRGRALRTAAEAGVPVVIACGLEKLVPSSVQEAVRAADRMSVHGSMGAAIDLLPVQGRVVTERESFGLMFGIDATVIASGGILGAEGSKTFVLQGPPAKVTEAVRVVRELKGRGTSGLEESMAQCFPGCAHCARHEGCSYLHGRRLSTPGSSRC